VIYYYLLTRTILLFSVDIFVLKMDICYNEYTFALTINCFMIFILYVNCI